MVTLTNDEMNALKAEGGKAAVDEHYRREAEIVFGHNYPKDANGNPIEKGIGSAGNPGPNHFTVIEMILGKEAADEARAKYKQHKTAKLKAELAALEPTQDAEPAPITASAAINLKGIETGRKP